MAEIHCCSYFATALFSILVVFLCSVNVLKFRTFCPKFCLFMPLFLKILSGMANSIDPDQTAPSGMANRIDHVQEQSDLSLYCLHMIFCQQLWCTKF